MKRKVPIAFAFLILMASLFGLTACQQSVNSLPATAAAEPTQTILPSTPTIAPTPIITVTVEPAVIPMPGAPDRPEFLAWPLPTYIGTARIPQYPNTPWTWNYLGLTPGYQCPPMFGYLADMGSLDYWRDVSIPEVQDRAQADPHNFEMVECYSTDGPAGSNGHEGTDIKAPSGTPVYAAADGKVMEWRLTGLNSMVVIKHCVGGHWDSGHQCANGRLWYTTYMHITPEQSLLQENADIAQGTTLGTVYNQGDNSHLHFEVGVEQRSYLNYINPWGRDESPWTGCMWVDQSICVNPDPDSLRMAYSTTIGRLFIQQGEREPVEINPAEKINQIRLWGERISLLDSNNSLLIWSGKDVDQSSAGSLSNWETAAEEVIDYQISKFRIAIYLSTKNLLTQSINPKTEWIPEASDVRAFSLSDHRLGYLTTSGDLFVKEGDLENDWVGVANNVLAFQVIDNRIAVLDQQHNLYVNEGEIGNPYELMAGDVIAFQLTNARLGIVDVNNNLFVKEGNLRAEWVLQAEQVRSFQLAGYRILVQGMDGAFRTKEGSLYQPWGLLDFMDLQDVVLNGEMPVYIK